MEKSWKEILLGERGEYEVNAIDLVIGIATGLTTFDFFHKGIRTIVGDKMILKIGSLGLSSMCALYMFGASAKMSSNIRKMFIQTKEDQNVGD